MILFKFGGDAALLELQFLLVGNGGRQFIFFELAGICAEERSVRCLS